ncbi:glyoxalase superfamily protein [Aminobacter aganoensis]|uniref:Putative glyoxalase superfamily protein PhnB n=1 Tax=Aminobacter aganoensis TaxID=83264 RepID=A0A7X0F8E3_9HYPH|nr:glyoxalase superfamily protein [Aminobacter aganoensis]MBB6354878.1 putative glyoxalase superfamily protein PhnB [Aminobacter aganoensis]
MPTLNRTKLMAKELRGALAAQDVHLSHGACLEIVARQLGFNEWNILKAACDAEVDLAMAILVEHGREEEAAAFYQRAFGAVRGGAYMFEGKPISIDLRIGDVALQVGGANPRREGEPQRGGPFFPKAHGAVSAVFILDVANAETALQRAIGAGAILRGELGVATDGRRGATVFDPFGHIWGLRDKTPIKLRRAA